MHIHPESAVTRGLTSLALTVACLGVWTSHTAVHATDLTTRGSVEIVPQLGIPDGLRLQFSADGKRFVQISKYGSVALWDKQTGQMLRLLRTHSELSGGIAVDPTGRWLAADAPDQILGVWDLLTGEQVESLSGHGRSITAVAFSSDGQRILSGSFDNKAILWDRTSGEQIQSFLGPQSIGNVAISPDGTQVATASFGGEVLVWDVASGKRMRTFACDFNPSTGRLTFSPNGQLLLATGIRFSGHQQTSKWGVWEVATGRQVLSGQSKDALPDMVFTPDGTQLVYGGGNTLGPTREPGTITVWDLASGKEIRSFKVLDGPVMGMAFVPDSRELLTFDGQKGLLWDWPSAKPIRTLELGLCQAVSSMTLSADGSRVLTGETAPVLWELATGQKVHQFSRSDQLYKLALTADGRRVVAAGLNFPKKENWLLSWNADQPSKVTTIADVPFCVQHLAITPDGTRALTTYTQSGIEKVTTLLWDLAAGEKLRTFECPTYWISDIAISADGRRVALEDLNNKVKVFDAADGRELQALQNPSSIQALTFSPDGRQLAVSFGFATEAGIILWDVETGKPQHRIEGCGNYVTTFAFSQDGRLLLGGARNHCVALWDVNTGKRVREFKGHTATLESVAFVGPAARHALTADHNLLCLWDVIDGSQLASIYRIGESGDWLAVTPAGLFDGSPKALEHVAFRVGSGLDVGPFDQAFQTSHRPGLLAQLLRGERPQPTASTAPSKAPELQIVSPSPTETADSDKLTVEVELADRGAGFKAPWLWHNSERLDRTTPSPRKGRYSFTVNLVPGDNRIEVHGVSADGQWRSVPVVQVVRCKEVESAPTRQGLGRPDLALQVGHSDKVQFTLLSPDGRTVATGSVDRTAILWDLETHQEIHVLRGHSGQLLCGAFSPDGKQLVTGDRQHTALIWDVASGRRIRSLGHNEWAVHTATYSPDGRQVVTATNKQVYFWDAASGKLLRTISAGLDEITHMALNTKGDRVATVQGDRRQVSAVIWDAQTGQKLRTIPGLPGKKLVKVAFSPDGHVVGLFHDPEFKESRSVVWDVETGAEVRSLADEEDFDAVAFSRDGKRSVAAAAEKLILWDPARGQVLRQIQGLNTSAATVAISPDAQRVLLCGTVDQPAMMIDAATGRWLYTLGDVRDIEAAAFRPDGAQFVVATGESAIVFSTANGREILRWQNDDDDVRTISYSADGKHILGCSAEDRASIWDASSGKRLRTMQAPSPILSAAFHPNGRQVVTGGGKESGQLILWDAQTGEQLRALRGHAIPVVAVAFSPDGRQLLSAASATDGGSHNKVILWDAATGESMHVLPCGPKGCKAVGFSRDGRLLFTLEQEDTDQEAASVVVWDAETGQRLRSLGEGNTGLESMALSADGRRLLTGAFCRAFLWDVEQGILLNTYQGAYNDIHSVSFTPDGSRILSGSRGPDDMALLWDAKTGYLLESLRSRVSPVRVVAFSPDGTKLVTANDGFGGSVVFWDLASGQIQTVLGGHGHQQNLHKAVFRADGRRIAVLAGGQQIIVWDPTARRQVCVCDIPQGEILDIAFTPDGRQIVAAGGPDPEQPGEVIFFDIATGRPADRLQAHARPVSSVAFSPDGRQMVTGSADVTAIVWDLGKRTKKLVLEDKAKRHTGEVRFVSFTPDGQQVLTGYFADAILWNASTGAKVHEFDNCCSVALSRDGKVLVGARDERVVSYDLAEGKLLRVMLGHTSDVTSVAIAPGGRHLLTGSLDGTSRLWDLEKGEELLSLVAVDGGADWVTVAPDGLFDGSAGGRQLVAFRIPGVDRPVPLDRFFNDFYRAGLLATIAEGQKIKAELQLGQSMPPRVRIVSPASGTVTEAQTTIRVETVDQGGGIAGVSIYQNGARLPASGPAVRKGDALEHSFDVRLVKGQNHFRVMATNSDGSWEAEPAEVVLTYQATDSKSRLYLVAIGINSYAESSLDLRFAAPDASAITELFRRRGQTLFDHVQATALIDRNATRDAIRQALKDTASQTREEDTLVVFVAGHGTMIGQRYYFIPHELRRQADPWEEDVRRFGVPADELSDWLGSAKALKRVLIFDTCAAGGATGAILKGRSGFELRGAMERLGRAQGVFAIAASDANEEAKEDAKLGHGVLSYTLLAGLRAVDRGPLAGKYVQPTGPDRVVNIMEWFSFAVGQVPRLTEKLYGTSQNVQATTLGSSFPVLPLED